MSDEWQPLQNEALLVEAYGASAEADRYSDAGEHAKAAEKYLYAHQLFGRCEHIRGQANSGLGRGRALIGLQRHEEAIAILDAARIQFLAHKGPIFRGAADCDQSRAFGYRQLGRIDEAIEAYRRALDTYPQNCEKERISSASGLAIVLAATGAHGEALDVLRDAEDGCHDRIHGIEISVNIGVFYADSGRYDAAYLQLERTRAIATAEGAHDLVASCDTNLGYVHLRAGRADHAATAYTRAKDRYEALRATTTAEDSRLDLKKKIANCLMNLGNAFGYAGDPDRALAAYAEAMIAFEALGQQDRIADCRMNMGVEHAARGEIGVAKELYQLAREYYQNVPGKARQAAGCIMNLARLDDASGRCQDAQQAHRSAAAEFRTLGLYEWEARCAVNLASSLAALGERTDVRAALDVLLPAMLHLDAVKFQFPTAAARLSWKRTVASANRLAFELASETGDAELVAELVETTINSGTHTSTHTATDITVGIETEAETIDSVTDTELMRPSNPGLAALGERVAGPIRLIAGAGLPMAPPPRLRMPSGRIALEEFHDAVCHYTPMTGQDCPGEPRIRVVSVT